MKKIKNHSLEEHKWWNWPGVLLCHQRQLFHWTQSGKWTKALFPEWHIWPQTKTYICVKYNNNITSCKSHYTRGLASMHGEAGVLRCHGSINPHPGIWITQNTRVATNEYLWINGSISIIRPLRSNIHTV